VVTPLGIQPTQQPGWGCGAKEFGLDVSQELQSQIFTIHTSAIRGSQSVASRWHLPLGTIICLLVESPI